MKGLISQTSRDDHNNICDLRNANFLGRSYFHILLKDDSIVKFIPHPSKKIIFNVSSEYCMTIIKA
jgi:hypothetical protein